MSKRISVALFSTLAACGRPAATEGPPDITPCTGDAVSEDGRFCYTLDPTSFDRPVTVTVSDAGVSPAPAATLSKVYRVTVTPADAARLPEFAASVDLVLPVVEAPAVSIGQLALANREREAGAFTRYVRWPALTYDATSEQLSASVTELGDFAAVNQETIEFCTCDTGAQCQAGCAFCDQDCVCASNEWTCATQGCIPADYECDSVEDCSDGSDEDGHCNATCTIDAECGLGYHCEPPRCVVGCRSGQFVCDNGQCIPAGIACNGINDCFDASDERGCASITCSIYQYRCESGTRCIPTQWECDGFQDCLDGSDEGVHCSTVNPGSPGAGFCSADRWCSEQPLPPNTQINGLWGSSAADVWAVGDNGLVMHWNGTQWRFIASKTTANLTGVWGADADYVWAVGEAGTVLRWDGVEWTQIYSGSSRNLRGVGGFGRDQAWAVGDGFTALRWNGQVWTTIVSTGSEGILFDAWCASEDACWLVGYQIWGFGTAYRWDGSALWGYPGSIYSGWTRRAVWGLAADNFWAVGERAASHWDGVDWTSFPGPDCLDVWGSGTTNVLAACNNGSIWQWNGIAWSSVAVASASWTSTLRAVWLDAGNTLRVTGGGFTGNVSLLAQDSGAGWQVIAPPTLESYNDLTGLGADSLWAVGNNGAIAQRRSDGWMAHNAGTTAALHAVWAAASDAVWVAGAGGTLLRYDGASWSTADAQTTSALHGLWGTSRNDVWAVGDGGVVRHYDGSGWAAVDAGTTTHLRGVWGVGSEVYVVGETGLVLHKTASGWAQETTPAALALSDVWGAGGIVYAVGDQGTLFKREAGTWSRVDLGLSVALTTVWGRGTSDVWVVGGAPATQPSIVRHFNGSAWGAQDPGIIGQVSGVWGNAVGETWLVGERGNIARRVAP